MVSKIDELIKYLIRVFNGTELTSESKKEQEKYGDYTKEDEIVRSQDFFILTKDLDDVLKEWFQGFKNEEELKRDWESSEGYAPLFKIWSAVRHRQYQRPADRLQRCGGGSLRPLHRAVLYFGYRMAVEGNSVNLLRKVFGLGDLSEHIASFVQSELYDGVFVLS